MAAAKKSSKKKILRKAAPKRPAAKRAGAKSKAKAASRKPAGKAAKKTSRKAAKKSAKRASIGAAKPPSAQVAKRAVAGSPKRGAAGSVKRDAGPKPGPAPESAAAKPATPPVQPAPGPRIGDDAPDFKLLDDAGRTQSLGNFRGRKVVLYFYPKDFTGGCTQQACDFRDNFSRIAGKGATVLGVSADSVDSHRRFKEKQGLDYLLLSDPGHEAIGSYGVWQEKSLYGRKFMGIVRSTFLIDEQGKIMRTFPKVKVGGHVDEVLAAL